MGVQGWKSYLTSIGLLPPDDTSPDEDVVFPVAPLSTSESFPRGSLFHVDGNGLVFHLVRLAYARFQKQQQKSAHLLSETARVQSLLPTFLPLSVLGEVTQEWHRGITTKGYYSVKVYWDGPKRPKYKSRTTTKRREKRAEEWSNLQDYLETGRRIAGDIGTYPLPALASAQVHSVLRQCSIYCPGEADDFIARAANSAKQKHNFVVGNDTDYTFMRGISYVPFTSIRMDEDGLLAGFVVTRASLAEHLGLPDEAAVMEVALLLGNDFVPALEPQKSIDDKLAELRSHPAGYRLLSYDKADQSKEEVAEAMDFCRRWYDLQTIRADELCKPDPEDEYIEVRDDEVGDIIYVKPSPESAEPLLPFRVSDKHVKFRPLKDKNMLMPTIRCVQSFLKRQELDGVFQQEHLRLLRSMSKSKIFQEPPPVLQQRPSWDDFSAVWLIQKILSKSFKASGHMKMLQLYTPANTFDAQTYLYHLHESRTCNDQEEKKEETTEPESAAAPPKEPPQQQRLPIDDHENKILGNIRSNRVTIIQGETGCGKSSRIPIFILRAPSPEPVHLPEVRIFVSQPRRIAAKALIERVRSIEPELGSKIALRMGHGVREYENNDTRAWFVTTGYLVRLLANHPERFNKVTHLIIDEVHERSVDTDILCLLCRRLLDRNPRIRLVLMSATLSAALYQEYFQVDHPVIHVGAKRFPIRELYLEDITKNFKLPMSVKKSIGPLIEQCQKMRCRSTPPLQFLERMFTLIAYMATSVGQPGSSVLIFVPGMNEIVAITELVEQIMVADVTFKCFPIHSDIPFEDQMLVFQPAGPQEIKIMIATNSAESSVTLPDCDHVICLGLCKQIVYNPASHRQMLVPTWISKASATQRAGRTSRVRPGNLYRMYTRDNFEHHMEEFEPGEMRRIPLDSVILMLKQILSDDSVTTALHETLEPPDTANIQRSFESLHASRFISEPEDDCEITMLGEFVSALGIDLQLGALIGLGIQFGVGAEAIQLASVLAFPKTPWIMSNPLIHAAFDYNDKVKKTYISRCHFDANLFSEPLGTMNLLWEYENASDNRAFCRKYSVFYPRLQRLYGSCDNLRRRVADFVKISEEHLAIDCPPVSMPHAKITILRIIQVWVFHENCVEMKPNSFTKGKAPDGFLVELSPRSDPVEEVMLEQVLDKARHRHTLRKFELTAKTCNFPVSGAFDNSSFEERLLSYASQKGLSLVWWDDGNANVFAFEASCEIDKPWILEDANCEAVTMNQTSNRRGIGERPCGMWVKATAKKRKGARKSWTLYRLEDRLTSKRWKSASMDLESQIRSNSIAALRLKLQNTQKRSTKGTAAMSCYSNNLTTQDLQDLFATAQVNTKTMDSGKVSQSIFFHSQDSRPMHLKKDADLSRTSWERPPVQENAPEGARLFSVLASGRRREQLVRIEVEAETEDKHQQHKAPTEEESEFVDLHLNGKQTSMANRWRRFNSDNSVYVNENSVPATALPLAGPDIVYCVCANSLEVKGGGLRVEGLTVLPQGRLFLLLCRLSFGLFEHSHLDNGTLVINSMKWLAKEGKHMRNALDVESSIEEAIDFHHGSITMGETLECFPQKVIELLKVFRNVEEYDAGPWDSLSSNVFAPGQRKKLAARQSSL